MRTDSHIQTQLVSVHEFTERFLWELGDAQIDSFQKMVLVGGQAKQKADRELDFRATRAKLRS
jgi:hypothetical protein